MEATQEKTIYTVVVADDEDELREAVCSMIPWETLGFSLVGEANNGLDALELVEKREPDLLLTDIRMPFISGIELARQVREIRPAMNIAFLSGYDDFEYAKQAIQYNIISYMLKPLTMEGLAQELTRIHEKIDAQFHSLQTETRRQAGRENFLMPLLLDDGAGSGQPPVPETQLRGWALECGLLADAQDTPRYVVLVTCLLGPDGANRTTPAQVFPVETLAEKYLRHVSFFSCGKVVTLLMGNPSDFEEYLHILGDEIIQVAQRVLRCRGAVGVSRETDRLAGLHTAYREAVEALSQNGAGEGGVTFITDVQGQPAALSGDAAGRITRIADALRAESRAGVDAGLDDMVDASHNAQYGRTWLDAAALQLVSEVYRVLYAGAGPDAVRELQGQNILPDTNFRQMTAPELKKALEDFCFCAMDLLSSQQKKGGSQLCRRALDAINQNYSDESLSLVSLSALLDVSPNHLSACIKKYEGESFINILIQKRMDAARELLLNSPLKIQEIAQRCGYQDQHYFSYCFKKYCGASPNVLRRQHEAEKGGAQ